MQLTSSGFQNGESIPKKYTGEGDDVSPPLQWTGAPGETQEFAILCEDPDAPQDTPFVHWLIYGIDPATNSLPEGIPSDQEISAPVQAAQGRNSFGRIGYNGPLPPVGHGPHRYFFKVYALNKKLGLKPGIDKDTFLKTARDHIVAEAELVGRYERGKKVTRPAPEARP